MTTITLPREVVERIRKRVADALDEPNDTWSDRKALQEVLRHLRLIDADLRAALAAGEARPVQHKPGCDALGGYGHGIGPCQCGAAPPQPTDRPRSSETDTAKATHGPSPERPVPNGEDAAAGVAAGGGEWRCVPVEPTREMVNAGAWLWTCPEGTTDEGEARSIWRAMVNRAPAPPQPAEVTDEMVMAGWQAIWGKSPHFKPTPFTLGLVRAALVAAMGAKR